ncbi:DEP domain-containing mTOR-interacting protein-like isoform X2 [Ostrea edulis]|uniref:DEP domain-containing mTOR-interacting protein-like isoform X2 n=1 Tax=Ostrea edulis TaxID=37623 RepID=UPI0020944A5E|nr:DEP domain-containing mTOR-interacting protein-like isoform X2 [Ostrea edulis]
MTDHSRKDFCPVVSTLSTYQIFLIGEQLRSCMNGVGLVRDRKYRLRSYKSCFQGNETVDWLVRSKRCEDRLFAVRIMRVLQKWAFFHHVCDDHKFKDEMLFYRFRRDDDTIRSHKDLLLFYKVLDIYHSINSSKKGILRSYQLKEQVYARAFMGTAFVDWLVKTGMADTKEQAIITGRQLLENDIIRHVTDDHHFRNDNMLLYQFNLDLDQRRRMSDVLILDDQRRMSTDSHNSTEPQDTPTRFLESHDFSTHANTCDNECYEMNSTETEKPANTSLMQPNSVLLRYETADELESPDTPYIKSCVRIFSDSVGYGFVIRGIGPTYVQTVDPEGPAADAGLKVRQYVYSVNGVNVLREDHHSVAQRIINSERDYINICVMSHKRDM